jgi:hypothetical protein
MRTPYDNGKIKMGSNYNPDTRAVVDDPDMLLLQTALICDTKAIRKEKAMTTTYIAVVVLVLFGYFLFT